LKTHLVLFAEVAVPIYGYIMPIILLVTFIANILIIMVLSKKHMRSPTNLVLMAMAISDLLTVVFPAPWYFLSSQIKLGRMI